MRSFVYPQNFSTKGRYDYVHAEGQLAYMLGLQAERMITSKTALAVGVRFLKTPTYYDVELMVPTAFSVTHEWRADRRNYRLYSGLSHTVLARGNKKFRVFGGFLAGVETQQLQLDRTRISSFTNSTRSIEVNFDYTAQQKPVWLVGAEVGLGLRLFDGVDLNLRYNYNFTETAPITYASTIQYDNPPGSPRLSTGTITGRPTFAAAELVVWFN